MSIRNELLEDIREKVSAQVAAVENHYYEVGRFNHPTDQPGGLPDERKTVLFGPAGDDDLGIVSLGADGVFTVNKSGPIAVKQRIRVTRPSNAGAAEVYFQAQVSADGTTWLPSGTTQHESIDEGGDTDVFLDFSPIEVVAGTKLRATWAQSSTGEVDADLVIATPSAAMLADGFGVVPSASTVIYAVTNFGYI